MATLTENQRVRYRSSHRGHRPDRWITGTVVRVTACKVTIQTDEDTRVSVDPDNVEPLPATAAPIGELRAAFRAGFLANINPATAPQRVAEGKPYDWTFDGIPGNTDFEPQAWQAYSTAATAPSSQSMLNPDGSTDDVIGWVAAKQREDLIADVVREVAEMLLTEEELTTVLRGFAARLALVTAAAPAPSPSHEHHFRDYAICSDCGLTEAAIFGCHHCDEVTPGARCWWCLTLKLPAAPSPEPDRRCLVSMKGRGSLLNRCQRPKGHHGLHRVGPHEWPRKSR